MSRCDECDPADLMVFGHAYDCTAHGIIRKPSPAEQERRSTWHRAETTRRLARIRALSEAPS